MKKIYLFAAAAALLTACSSEELSNTEVAQQNSAESPVAFSIYTPRNVTRAGAPSTIDDTSLKTGGHADYGFGVFGYYTNATDYVTANTFPNFMYNQQVTYDGSNWKYEPVKYWPNEFGNAATSDDIDRVTFFSYAPWTRVNVSTGIPAVPAITDYDAFVAGLNIKIGADVIATLADYKTEFGYADEDDAKAALDDINKDLIQGTNIAQMTRNTATGDPIIKYAVDTNPISSVDLLWGVAAADYETTWGTTKLSDVKEGFPFIDLVKPSEPTGTGAADSKVKFNLRHALAKLIVTIDYKDDTATPGTLYTPEADKLNNKETKIFVRQITIGGFVMKGALNLNNTIINKPNWKNFDGSNEITYEPVTFKDGRRDGKEGTADGAATNETYLGLNPNILQRTPYEIDAADNTKFDADWTAKNTGVTASTVNLFGRGNENFKEADGNAAIFVIPMDQPMDVEIVYDVETINPKLNDKLSDGITNGSTIENKIRKLNVVGEKMTAGHFYTLNIHLGMTSAKFEATVQDWIDGHDGTAELPANQN